MNEDVVVFLVNDAKNNDKIAFSKLYEMVYKDLYKVAYYTLNNQHDAEDAVSDTVIAAYESISLLRDAKAFKGWIFKILANKCKKKLKQYTKKLEELKEDSIIHDTDLEKNMDLKAAFIKLTKEEKLILSMFVFGGYQSKEIASMLHLNHSTVRSKQKRALEKLQKSLL